LKINYLQRFLSFFYPIKIATAIGKTTPILGLYRFQNRWQLSASTALYSDGAAYKPLLSAFSLLKKELPQMQTMLILGAGLGSAVSILNLWNIKIPCTLVEIDPQIITWGKEILGNETNYPCTWICDDVELFVTRENSKYDLIILDVFQDRVVPQSITSFEFLNQCAGLLKDQNSFIVFNYIINNLQSWENSLERIRSIFQIEHIISIGINRILILRNTSLLT
jgi:spermidine synthase